MRTYLKYLAGTAVLAATIWGILPRDVRGQEALDPPLPPGSADDLEARMRARREAAGTPPQIVVPVGGFGGEVAPSGGGFAGFVGEDGGRGGRSGAFGGRGVPYIDPELRLTSPVFTGCDPALIPPSDKIITQIIPLKYLQASTLRYDFRSVLPNDALYTVNSQGNCLVLTDTAAHVRHFVEILAALEKEAATRPTPVTTVGRGFAASAQTPVSRIYGSFPQAADKGVLETTALIGLDEVRVPVLHDGIVREATIGPGLTVKRGDVLLRLDTRELQARIDEDEARIAAMNLVLRRLPASAKDDAESYRLELARLQAAQRAKQAELETMIVRAPIDGEIVFSSESLPLVQGAYVTRGTVSAVMVSRENHWLNFRVIATDAKNLHVGQKLTFTPSSTSKEPASLGGEITYIAPMAETLSFLSSASDKPIYADVVTVRGKITSDAATLPGLEGGGSNVYSGSVTITIKQNP